LLLPGAKTTRLWLSFIPGMDCIRKALELEDMKQDGLDMLLFIA
jgi:hypothetical protein